LKDALNRIKLRNAGLEMGKRNAGEAMLRAVIRAAPQSRGSDIPVRVPPAQPLVSATKRRRETPAAATRADA
jgi:hypothetical protein